MKPAVMWDFRIRHDLTLVELVERLGVHKSQVSRWETGKREIPLWVEKFLACLDKEARAATMKPHSSNESTTYEQKGKEAGMSP